MKSRGSFAAIRKDAAFWSTNVFGTLTAAASIISIVQHLFDISLVPAFARGLLAYRYIAHTVTEWLLAPLVYVIETLSVWLKYPLVIDAPQWWLDLTLISLVSAGAAIRSQLMLRQVRSLTWTQRIAISAMTIFFGLTMFGLLWLMLLVAGSVIGGFGVKPDYIPSVIDDPEGFHQKAAELSNLYYGISIIAVAVASAGFFLLNYFVL